MRAKPISKCQAPCKFSALPPPMLILASLLTSGSCSSLVVFSFESFIGAMLVTRGYDATSAYLTPLLLPWIERISHSPGFHDRYRTSAAGLRAKRARRAEEKAMQDRLSKQGLLKRSLRRAFAPLLAWAFPEAWKVVQKRQPER